MSTRTTRFIVLSVVASLSLTVSARAGSDFNGDGYDDLVVTAPTKTVDGQSHAGMVHIVYGRNGSGLSALNDHEWTQNSEGIAEECEGGDYFGNPAVGNFNGDGYDDLAIGVHLESVDGLHDAGAFHVLYGSAAGLTADGSQYFTQATPGVASDPGYDDRFGTFPCVGDFNGDGFDDLTVSAFLEDVNGKVNAGSFHVFYGSNEGLLAAGSRMWTQDSAGVLDQCEPNDGFGLHRSSGDFNGDGYDDLAIGISGESVGTIQGAGMVQVLYGSAGGLSSLDQVWTQNTAGIADTAEKSDLFGMDVAAGDFNGDGYDDLAIGVCWESWESWGDGDDKHGAVHVIYGSANRLRSTGAQYWTQDTAGIADHSEIGDQFGSTLATGDFNGDGRDDLVVGVATETINGHAQAGAVHMIRGSANGLTAVGSQFWHPDSAGIIGTSQPLAGFGWNMATGDFNQDGKDDLAIGAPWESVGGVRCGAVHVLRGASYGLSSIGDQLWSQAALGGVPALDDQFGRHLSQSR